MDASASEQEGWQSELRIAELCAGDGALAERLIKRFNVRCSADARTDATDEDRNNATSIAQQINPTIGEYCLLERNKKLRTSAQARLGEVTEETHHPTHGGTCLSFHGCRVCVANCDVTSEAGQEQLAGIRFQQVAGRARDSASKIASLPNLWIASGSTLCGGLARILLRLALLPSF